MANEMDEGNEALCGKCENKVQNDMKAILCDGFCKKWFHIKCVNVKSNNYEAIKKLSDDVMWVYMECKIYLKKIVECDPERMMSVCMNENKCNEQILLDIKNRVKSIENKLSNNSTFAPKTSYAEIVKQRSINKEDICNEGIIIKPKKGKEDLNLDTMKIVKQSIDPCSIGVPIKKIKKIRGGIIIKSNKTENNEKLAKEAIKKLSNNFEVRGTKQRNPTISIPNMRKEYNSEMLIRELRALNHEINEEDDAKVVYCRKNKITNKYTIYSEVNKSLYNKICNKYINMDWNTILVREDYGIIRCYKCQKFNHKAANCKCTLNICKNCGESHKTTECKNTHVACINCKLHPKYTKNCNHKADSLSCPLILDKIKQQVEKTNYNINKVNVNVN